MFIGREAELNSYRINIQRSEASLLCCMAGGAWENGNIA